MDNLRLMVDGSGSGGGGSLPAGPTLTTLTPATLPVGSPTTSISIAGTGFVAGCAAHIGANFQPATFISATLEMAPMPGDAMLAPGTLNVTVVNPGTAHSNSKPFTVTAAGAQQAQVLSISPTSAETGCEDVEVTITGTGFTEDSAPTFGGTVLDVEFVSDTELRVTIPAALLATPGSRQLHVGPSYKVFQILESS